MANIISEETNRTVESSSKFQKKMSRQEVEQFMRELDSLAKENSKYVPKGFDSVKALREIRYGKE